VIAVTTTCTIQSRAFRNPDPSDKIRFDSAKQVEPKILFKKNVHDVRFPPRLLASMDATNSSTTTTTMVNCMSTTFLQPVTQKWQCVSTVVIVYICTRRHRTSQLSIKGTQTTLSAHSNLSPASKPFPFADTHD
jgi:hypothetical protein